ncbi:MAG: NUDIX hydrolase [Bacteroidetes bacterium]|nr:NUDIX hydrolase [Bacteroidota bacterium]
MSEPQKWQVLESHYVLDRQPYMTLREDKVALPNGAIIEDYFVFEYPSWVIVLALTPAREVVLIRQYRHGIGAVFFELAAGVPDAGENLLDCAQRELLEETGYGGGEWQLWMEASANPATHTNTGYIFLARGVQQIAEQTLDVTEEIAVQVLPELEVLRLLRNNQIFQALHAAALWRYFAECTLQDGSLQTFEPI